MSESEDPSQTTSFMAQLPGGAMLKFASKSPIILLAVAITVALVFNALLTWDLRIKSDLLTLSVREMSRSIRELTCLQYIPADERTNNSGQAAACRRVGEMQ